MAKIITNKFPADCDFCHQFIEPGEKVVFLVPSVGPTNNIFCMRCDKKLRNKVYTIRGY